MSIETDLEIRDRLRHYLNERSLTALAARFSVSATSIWLSEGRDLLSLTDAQNAELKQLRREYHQVKPEIKPYSLPAIAQRHGVGAQWVSKKWRKMLDQRIEQGYGRRIAA